MPPQKIKEALRMKPKTSSFSFLWTKQNYNFIMKRQEKKLKIASVGNIQTQSTYTLVLFLHRLTKVRNSPN